MADRKSFLIRVDATVLEAVQRWANDDLRSLNAQVEFLLRRSLQQAGRGPGAEEPRPFAAPQAPGTSRRSAKRSGEK